MQEMDTRDRDLIPGLGRSPGVGNGNPLQFSCLENPMDRGAWWGTVHGVAKRQTQLSTHTHTYFPNPKIWPWKDKLHVHKGIEAEQ